MFGGRKRIRNAFYISFVISDADVVAGWGEGVPGDVEPATAGEELLGQGIR